MPRHLALDAPAVDHVVAGLPLLEERLDQLGRVLQVAVEQHHAVLGRHLHAAAERHLRAEVARMADADHARVALADLADRLGAVVRAAVVDEDDLVVDGELAERGAEALVHDRYRRLVAVAGDDGRDAAPRRAPALLGRHRHLLVAEPGDPARRAPAGLRAAASRRASRAARRPWPGSSTSRAGPSDGLPWCRRPARRSTPKVSRASSARSRIVVLTPLPMLKASPYRPGCMREAASTKAAQTSSTCTKSREVSASTSGGRPPSSALRSRFGTSREVSSSGP